MLRRFQELLGEVHTLPMKQQKEILAIPDVYNVKLVKI